MNWTRRRIAPILLVFVILLEGQVALNIAHGDYQVSVTSQSVSLSITTSFVENLTDVNLPINNLVLSGSNASIPVSAFSAALSKLVPGAAVSSFALAYASTANSTKITISSNIDGVITSSNGQSKINLAWKSFDVTSDIASGTLSINLIGAYLTNSSILGRTTSSVDQWSYSEDGSGTSARGSVQAASSFNLLDFSQLAKPVQTWSQKMDITRGSTVFSNFMNHNLTVTSTIQEPEGPVRTRFVAGYTNQIQIAVAGSVTIIGDNVFTDANSSNALTMLGIILATPIVGITASILEWRINKSGRSWAQRKGRTRSR